ncbi:sigma-54-dependent transcriptional regulator [Noviherbaspirillum aridicola]|uniref:Acetoacetate metabolism regulatory protein AtoC n=1 Tax=Noviherbaspirillum aridicola TaxID=2849687 RepID=A0ABQ4Q676_9BURK|nr:sigma-54 dependent transcriptional regulator [Noviherbaspirillum aridicola]GIZ52718.1 acetoacetate metabolism regulatory protein AtoC [Noviherbaspirillum aridicola]
MKSLEVLVVDDEPAIRQILAAHLGRAGFSVCQAGNGTEAFERLSRGDIDVAISDIKMPDFTGIDLVRRARAAGIETSFIMMTAYASVDTAIEAIKAGASDYMIKPVRNEEVMHRLEKVRDMRRLSSENRVLRNLVLGSREPLFGFVSSAMKALERLVAKVAPTDSTVLVTGESGTGKGVIARQIHQNSLRADGPFIPVNCGAIPENLMESELFGHVKGSFTGADKARKGLFLEADKGTIFLDEIGELPLALQVKLLHVIEEKTVRPVGSEQARRADVRIVAATNRDLRQMVAEGKFREDLYFRLSVFHVHVPPLRERRQDIPGLVHFLLQRSAKRLNNGGEISIDADVEEILSAYDWPGNVREMENVVDRALILADEGRITRADLPPQVARVAPPQRTGNGEAGGESLREQVRRFESTVICKAIADANGDRRAAAQKLGIGLSSLYRKLEEYEALGILPELVDSRQR